MHRVLVIDDNEDAADSLAQLLRLDGHEVEVAYNGMSALARVRAFRPDVVLCDLGLPELSGYDVAKALRCEPPCVLRIIAISGYAQPDDIRRAREAGFDAHLAKPPDAAQLQSLLGQGAAT